MSLISATSGLRTFATLLGLVPFTFCQKSNKFVLFRYLPISLIKCTLSMVNMYFILRNLDIVGTNISERLIHETPMQLIMISFRLFCVYAIFIYDIIQLFEKNFRKQMYCEAINEIVELSELVGFENVETPGKVCRKLRRYDRIFVTMSILCYCGFFYYGTVVTNRLINFNILYFNTHILMIVIDSLYIGQLFVTLRSFVEYVTAEVSRGESIKKVKLIEIHRRVVKVIKKLTKAHGVQIIASYLVIILFNCSSYYNTYALHIDFSNVSSLGIYLGIVSSLLAFSFLLTWNLVKLQDMVSPVCPIVSICKTLFYY